MHTCAEEKSDKRGVRFRYFESRDRGMVDVSQEKEMHRFIPFTGELVPCS